MEKDIPAGVGRLGGLPVFGLGILVLAVGGIAGVTASLVFDLLDDDYDAQLVELSLAVLASDYDPADDNEARVRRYALDALEKATGTELSDAERNSWLRGTDQLLPASMCVAPEASG